MIQRVLIRVLDIIDNTLFYEMRKVGGFGQLRSLEMSKAVPAEVRPGTSWHVWGDIETGRVHSWDAWN